MSNCQKRYRNSRLAFTLIELLVVITIIGMLIALLMPSLSYAKHYTQLIKCKVNLKSQATAHYAYGIDNNDRKPAPSIVLNSGRPLDNSWMTPAIKRYNRPVAQGKLIEGGYLGYEQLLCPSLAMSDDNNSDLNSFEEKSNVGSSYMYYWRNPVNWTEDRPVSAKNYVTYTEQMTSGEHALAMDINFEDGHGYLIGGIPGKKFSSHPVTQSSNIAFLDGSVRTKSNNIVKLKAPGSKIEKRLWWDVAHLSYDDNYKKRRPIAGIPLDNEDDLR